MTRCWRLPAFLRRGETSGADRAAIEDAFRLTGFFLTRHVYEPRAIAEPEARAAFLAALRKAFADPAPMGKCRIASRCSFDPARVERPPHERQSNCCRAMSRRLGWAPFRTRIWPNIPGSSCCSASSTGNIRRRRSPGLLNFTLTEVGEGRAVFRGLPGERHLNPLGGVHGGWAATIMDSALGLRGADDAAKGRGLHAPPSSR